jgi:hypothetical protein
MEEAMSEQMLIKHCAPTLAGLKTGNLFSCLCTDIRELRESIRSFNRRLSKKGLRVIPLQYKNGRALVYVYRCSHLERDLENEKAKEILASCGYKCTRTNCCVSQLVNRLANEEGFPHEIGIFLGYPPEDVYGFISEKNGTEKNKCKLVGHWKVYGDEKEAKNKFDKYNKCTDVYGAKWLEGHSIEKLAVNG